MILGISKTNSVFNLFPNQNSFHFYQTYLDLARDRLPALKLYEIVSLKATVRTLTLQLLNVSFTLKTL